MIRINNVFCIMIVNNANNQSNLSDKLCDLGGIVLTPG